MTDEKRRPEAGDTVREGVRSIVGILGALKDAIEQEFEGLRGTGERTPAPDREKDTGPAEPGDDAVEDLRDRFDFVPRKELEALRKEVESLSARLDALEKGAGPAPAGDELSDSKPPEPPEARPFRIDSD